MRLLIGATFVACSLGISSNAAAQTSAGCVFLGGVAPLTVFSPGFADLIATPGQAFDAGEVINLSVAFTGAGGTVDVTLSGTAGFESVTLTFGGAGTQTTALTVPATGADYVLFVNMGGGTGPSSTTTFLNCTGGSGDSDSQTNAERSADRYARQSFNTQRNFISGRTQRLAIRRPDAASGVDPIAGAAGQGAATPFGVWADLSFTGLEDRASINRSEFKSAAAVVGVDTPLDDDFIVGGAFTSIISFTDDQDNGDESFEVDFGLLPYFVYRLNDQFSLQGAAGLSGAFGHAEFGGVGGDTHAIRYFVSAEAGYFESWDNASLYAGLNLLWGQSHQFAYTDEGGTQFGSITTRLGSLAITMQPSYTLAWDAIDGFVEPFAIATYSYDFAQSKVSGVANDPDAFDVGLGANFYADAVTGGVEVSRMLGREDVNSTTGRITVRIDF